MTAPSSAHTGWVLPTSCSSAGRGGLYTSTLFDMKPDLFRSMGPALEMGRSFVCARYQRSASGLFLLWRGIGQFVATPPVPRAFRSGEHQRGVRADLAASSWSTSSARDHMHPLGSTSARVSPSPPEAPLVR